MFKTTLPLLACLLWPTFGCSDQSALDESATYAITTVKRQDVVVQISATGRIEPIREVEIKSKASGMVIRVPVEAGDQVKYGNLLAQVDTTDVAADLRQVLANLEFRRSEELLTRREKERANDLLERGMISPQERDRTALEWARAHAGLVSTEAEVDRARDRVHDTVVRAASAGTILETFVAEGQIITSATSQVGGGTSLMRVADLRRLYARVLVDEVDLGQIRPGLPVTVRVEAYPKISFDGTILKVEPTWRKERDIIYFPIVVELDNVDGFLLPGMTCEAKIHVARSENVLAVTNHALVATSFASETAELLHIPANNIHALLDSLGVDVDDPTRAMLFVAGTNGRFAPRVVTMGAKNWEVTEILDGVDDSTTVVIPPSAAIAKQFAEYLKLMRRHASSPGRR
jgi:HlyD family secretion protein